MCCHRPDIDPLYAERWSTTEVGKRGGLRCPGTRPHVTIPWHGYFAELLQWYTVKITALHSLRVSG